MNQRAILFAALAAATFQSVLPAQATVRITNMADVARKQWVDLAVPLYDGAPLPELCQLSPQGFTVWKGATVGVHTQMFHAYVEMAANETITGTIVGVTSDPAQMVPFGTSDWVDDDSVAVIPRLRAMKNGVEHRLGPISFEMVEQNRARQVFRLRSRIGTTPLVFEEWIYVYSMQDIVRFEMTITNCDPRTSPLSYTFDYLWVEAGEYMFFDYRKVEGMPLPDQQDFWPWHGSFGNWFQILSTTRTMGRGEQLFFSGAVYAGPAAGRAHQTLFYPFGQRPITLLPNERIANFYADSRGPLVGVGTGWQGKWLAFGILPEVPPSATNGGWTAANASASNFRLLQESTRDVYAQRPRGLNQSAGSTGSQEDFGASKGAFAVTVGDPRFLHEAGYSMFEMFGRPFHYREADGSALRAANHPALRTWSQIINCRTTGDMLGMVCPLPYSWPSNGWTGIDDQHRSQNNANMMLALTGSHALRQAVRELLQIDLTQEPGFVDSPRGEGRLQMAWSNMLLLLDDPQERTRLLSHMGTRVQNLRNVWPGRQFLNDPTRPIRVLEVGRSPTFLDPQGAPIPAIVVWEHSIAAMGMGAAYRMTGDLRYRELAAEVSRMIVNHCIYQHGSQWIACTNVRYLQGAQEGMALPPSSYSPSSPDIEVGVSFWEWIFPSVLICRELYRNSDPALVARCDQIITWMGGPSTWQRSEWWAVLPR